MFNNRIEAKLDLVIMLLGLVLRKEQVVADTLDEIVADVASETTVENSIITLLNGIAAQLAAAQQDPAKLAALHASLTANIAAMTVAVTANTVPPAGGATGATGATGGATGA